MPFGKVTIIGVGLIGSSLARALKGIASEVAGCSRKQETIDTALKLSAIDSGATNPVKAVKSAEIVVLCTPLSTYAAITEAIAPHLPKHCVLTDAGSVKHAPSQEILKHLSRDRKPLFVPGHPIAGTEKSGPEAGFKELFRGKKTLLTPLPLTDAKAIAKVTAMWEAAGSEVETLDAERHDYIYAVVSHAVQFLSSAYGLMMEKEDVSGADDNFRAFIRLAGSDPVMWRDIFLYNRRNLEAAITDFLCNLDALGENDAFQDRLKAVRAKREYFEILRGARPYGLHSSAYKDPQADLCMRLLPRLLACALMETIQESEYAYATGAGLHSFTENLLLPDAADSDVLITRKKDIATVLKQFKAQVNKLMAAVESGNGAALENLLRRGRNIYT